MGDEEQGDDRLSDLRTQVEPVGYGSEAERLMEPTEDEIITGIWEA